MGHGFWVRWGAKLLADIDQTVPPVGALAIWYLGQEGLVLKGDGMVVYVDPYLGNPMKIDKTGNSVPRRKFPPPFLGSDIRHADVVLGTHNHSDHIDLPTLEKIAGSSPRAHFVVPAPHVGLLASRGIGAERVTGARVGEAVRLGGLTVVAVPAAHEELERDANGDLLALGYVLHLNGISLYHAGDTVEYPGMIDTVRQHDPDVVCLPINGRDALRQGRGVIGNMNFREAADVGQAMGARLLIPMHYDVFPDNSENPAFFVDYLYRTYPAQPFKMLVPGERVIYCK